MRPVRKADNLPPSCAVVMKSGNLNCPEPSGTNWKVPGSIPAVVSGFFIDIKSFRSHYGPGVDSASNRNEYQEYFLGLIAAGA